MSVKEKGHPPNRRVAAVSFLNSISLNGSYRDSCWPVECDKCETGLPVPSSHSLNSNEAETQRLLGGGRDDDRNYAEKHRNSSVTGDSQHNRTRSNTGSFCRPDGYPNHPKHAHFSSSESLDHGNTSDFSVHYEKTTMVNMTTDSLPSIKNERLVILVSHRSPLVVFSSLPYSRDNRVNRIVDRPELTRRARNTSGSRPISTLSDPDPLEQLVQFQEEEVSYGYLLQPTKAFHQVDHSGGTTGAAGDETDHLLPPAVSSSCHAQDVVTNGTNPETSSLSDGENQDVRHGSVPIGHKSTVSAYSPHMLDDPEFRAGKHRTLLTFPSYITSVIDYCKASDMKKELNDKFKDRFPHIHLTLSKLRSLKREMRRVAKAECNVDLLTVAQAYVYFEKLILGSFVTKYNRKFCAGACLLLSAKLNDVKGGHLHNLFDMIERTFRVNRKELLTFEFAVLVGLEFTLHLPTWEVFPHYQRLLYES